MKVKVTATVSYDIEYTVDMYSDVENGPKTEDEIIPFEMKALEEGDTCLAQDLMQCGEVSNIKIEKLEETAAPVESAAA